MSDNNKIYLEVNGSKYEGFKDISINRSLDSAYGTFNFTATSNKDNPVILPIQNGEPCKVWILNNLVVDGFVEILSISYDANSHLINIQGRDKIADFTDSTVIGNANYKAPIGLIDILRKTLDIIGFTKVKIVTSSVKLANELAENPFNKEEDLATEVGGNAFEFIQKLCKKRQVLLIPSFNQKDELQIMLTRAENTEIDAIIRNKIGGGNSNVLSGQANYNNAQRYFAYICRSQGNMSTGLNDPNIDSKSEIAYDREMRTTRVLEFQAESLSSIECCKARADFEANVRRAKSSVLNYTMQGFFIDQFKQDGIFANLWQLNRLIKVEDDFLAVNAEMLINDVTYSFGDGGEKTTLGLVPQDAYSLLSSRDKKEKKINNIANDINNINIFDPATWQGFIKNLGVDL